MGEESENYCAASDRATQLLLTALVRVCTRKIQLLPQFLELTLSTFAASLHYFQVRGFGCFL